jgi:predicted RNA-binding Zn-ribbon protein involved in translation (DUF1610 family)
MAKPKCDDKELTEAQRIIELVGNKRAIKLVTEVLAGNISEIQPRFDYTSEPGFCYPAAEKLIGAKSEEVVSILESLAANGILSKSFFDRLLRCPQCQSINLRPTTHCPKCGSGNIVRGRILEHPVCQYVGLEEDFVSKGRYVCPKCHQALVTAESNYRSLGLLYKCLECDSTFNLPQLKWRCLKCSSVTAEDKVTDITIYSYSFNEAKRSWLEFELKPKLQLIEFLKQRGYKVSENALVKGRSGAEHKIDILATRDDGIINYTIAIGIKVAGEKIELDEIFDFDDKAYDIGIHDKVLVIVPELGREAEKFASQQRIKVLEVRDLDSVLSASATTMSAEVSDKPFEFSSKSELIRYLQCYGYEVKENATAKGKSGAEHTIDILATKDDGIITHHIAIGIELAEEPVSLDKVFDFDDKAYDIGIMDKAFIAVPGLTQEARQFAQRQRIKVFEVSQLEAEN